MLAFAFKTVTNGIFKSWETFEPSNFFPPKPFLTIALVFVSERHSETKANAPPPICVHFPNLFYWFNINEMSLGPRAE